MYDTGAGIKINGLSVCFNQYAGGRSAIFKKIPAFRRHGTSRSEYCYLHSPSVAVYAPNPLKFINKTF